MYTIRQAAARSGISVPLLRAWERRYGIVVPERTAAGYRLYDEAALERLGAMRRLVDAGWTPSVAAAAIVGGEVSPAELLGRAAGLPRALDDSTPDPAADEVRQGLIERFVAGAIALDAAAIEGALDAMFATASFEVVADHLLLPALGAIGDAWSSGRLGVAGEHAASHAMLRRLSAAFQAAGTPGPSTGGVLVGLPPSARHELAALAFSVAARRTGLAVLYLGPDLPADDWVATAARTGARAAVIATPTAADVGPAVAVARALHATSPALTIAFGGRGARSAREAAGVVTGAVILPDGMAEAVATLRTLLAEASASA
jgi:DNA-binding transcriptional MerR regulator